MFKTNTGIIQKIRQSRTFKGVSVLVLFSLVFEIAQPSVSLALTEGPSQPEVQSFEPIGTTQMVDLFSGDFNYNIPLFNLPGPNGGYPVNLAYHAGASMDDEASWVGLGWNINVGSLVRSVRGLPDEFMSQQQAGTASTADGGHDYLEVQTDMKESWTLGLHGAFAPEVFGANLDVGESALSASASIYYNNYQGVGVSVGPTLSIGTQNGAYNFGLSLDSENGLGVSASLDIQQGQKFVAYREHTLGLTFDGSLSVDYSTSSLSTKLSRDPHKAERWLYQKNGDTQGAGISFARTAFSASVGQNVNKYNLAFNIKTGITLLGAYGAGSVGLFYNTQDYSNEDKHGRKHMVVGYAEAGNDQVNSRYMNDFSRENEGQITKSSMFLANSHYTYDVFNSTGQGLSGYFRARRSDVGRSYDPYIYNSSEGLSLSLDLSQAHVGAGVGVNFGWDTQGPWNDLNDFQQPFQNPATSGANENTYYQIHGEQTILDAHELDYIRGLNLPFVRLKTKDADGQSGGRRVIDTANPSSVPNNEYGTKRTPSSRVVRNTLIQNLRNEEVGQLGEFNIKYFTDQSQVYGSPAQPFARDSRNGVSISKHPAGYKVLGNEGSNYVYGLPAYNLKEVDNLFSVAAPGDPANTETVGSVSGSDYYKANGTNQFINKTTKSPYAHSYLLTAVQGADYIDLTNNGPSDDDMGYWVKFNYLQSTSNFKWRAPYAANQYSQGQLWTAKDDKASYQYGEKEMWYLGQIETKTHIAVFVMSNRDDMREADQEYNEGGTGSDQGKKLTEIRVYDKKTLQANQGNLANAIPLQKIVFDYHAQADAMCHGALNATGSQQAKLTLKAVHFESNGSTRGSQNAYNFDYTSTNTPNYDNPSYAMNSYDSWGNYKPKGAKFEHHSRFPYVNQFNQDWNGDAWEPNYGTSEENTTTKQLTQQTQDALASAWCLKKITLPSGGTINIQYESDDYGYVQHKTANQMFKIQKLGDDASLSDNEIYDSSFGNNDFYNPNSFNDELRRRIYFKLEYPIPNTTSAAVANKQVYDDYVTPIIQDENGDRNLYYKTKMKLSSGVFDYVAGYLPLESVFDAGNGNYNFGVDANSVVNGNYTRGYVTVKAAKKKNGNYYDQYHPLALAGWTYLQTNAQMVLSNSANSNATQLGDSPSTNDVINQLTSIMSIVPATASSFGSIRSYCWNHGLASSVDLNYSCIRLASPDKKKFGGGHRVKEISITDNWSGDTGNSEQSHSYGQRFDYTIQEGTKTISSGVAQYEPQAGGDENPLKYPIYYFDKQNLLTRNNLFAEAPMNESLFPGATVGYRKVTVTSINTSNQLRNAPSSTAVGRTGGVTVNEFYTAKDFPTIVSYSLLAEENSTKDVFNLPITIPLIGSIKRNYYHGTQAYMIELNDMHGKPKSMETFELNGYAVNPNPITSASYDYQYDVISYQGETVKKLNNEVNVIPNDGTHTVNQQKRLMGVETDLFTDQRESKAFNMSFGADFNADIPFIPILTIWPTLSNSKTMFRTYVTNKVIHRTGILKRTKTRDLQTVNESEIVAYDEKSGIPLLTKIKNEFGDNFYNYNIPAYYAYDRMGHAYQNINYTFDATLLTGAPDGATTTPYLECDATGLYNNLVRGDELLITKTPAGSASALYKKIYFLGWKYTGNGATKAIFHSPFGNVTVGSGFGFRVIRSGNRNQFGGAVASYTTKGKVEDLIRANPATSGAIDNAQVDPVDAQITTPRLYKDVLSATASIFRDDWSTSIQTDFNNDLITENPFLTGNSGIWRPVKSYTYVGARKTSASMSDNSTSDPQLYNDGVFRDPVPMFTWSLGNIETYTLTANWEWVNEVTRYSPDAYELENRNRLGIQSSALYGYDNSLSIGVASNAGYNEVGVFDFETIVGGGATNDFIKVMSQTNLNFDNNHSVAANILTDQFRIKRATVSGTNINIQASENTDIPADYFTGVNSARYVGLSLTTRKNNGVLGNIGYYFNGILFKSASNELVFTPFLRRGAVEKLVADDGVYHGVITFFNSRANTAMLTNAASYVTTKAHSGKKSMRLSGSVLFDQPRLKLKAGNKYILSFWASRTNENVPTYEPNDVANDELVQVGKMSSGSLVALSNAPVIKYGKIVEGWQKVDVEFKWDNVNDIPAINFTPQLSVMFVDDIRISPKTGGLATYVYDSVKYWLTASLNADNYATFFYYDEQGNLHLKKQETEKGIFTITESRGNVSR